MSLTQKVRGGIAFVGDLGRLREILGVLVRYGWGDVVMRLNLDKNLFEPPGSPEQQRKPRPERLVEAIEQLGPTFIKLGQVLSTRPEVLAPEYLEAFESLQDRVNPLEGAQVRAEIERSLGKPVEELFGSFEEQPLASASIAQVHRATLKDGRQVVVKVRRPNISRVIDKDLQILGFLARRLDKLEAAKLVDLPAMVDEFGRSLRAELDFRSERDNLDRFRHNFRETEFVVIPEPHVDLSTDSVLTMDFVAGVKVTEAQPEDGEAALIAQYAVRALFEMLLNHGFFHADMHPGNVLVTPDNKLGLLDCGMIGRLSARAKDTVVQLLGGIASSDSHMTVQSVLRMSTQQVPVNEDEFTDDLLLLIDERLAGRSLSEFEVAPFLTALMRLLARHQIQLSPQYTMLLKTLVTVEGIGKAVAPDIDIIEEARPFVTAHLKERYSLETMRRELLKDGRYALEELRVAPRALNRTLHQLTRGELTLKIKSDDDERLAKAHVAAGNRIGTAIMTVGLTLAGTIALQFNPWQVKQFGLPLLSFLLYFGAGVAGVSFWLLARKKTP